MPALNKSAALDETNLIISQLDYHSFINKLKDAIKKNNEYENKFILAEKNLKDIHLSNTTPLISKVLDGTLLAIVQMQASTKQMQNYIEQYEENNTVNAKKIQHEIMIILDKHRMLLEYIQREYDEFLKKQEQIKKEIEILALQISILNNRLNEIWLEQHRIIASMFTDDTVIHIPLNFNDKEIMISVSMHELRDEIIQTAASRSSDNFELNLEEILSYSIKEIFYKKYNQATEPVSESALNQASENAAQQSLAILKADPNFINHHNHLLALESEKAEIITEIKIHRNNLITLQHNNENLVSSMNQCLTIMKEQEKTLKADYQEIKTHNIETSNSISKNNSTNDEKYPHKRKRSSAENRFNLSLDQRSETSNQEPYQSSSLLEKNKLFTPKPHTSAEHLELTQDKKEVAANSSNVEIDAAPPSIAPRR